MELEVRMRAESFVVNLQLRKYVYMVWGYDWGALYTCSCIAASMHLNKDHDEGVSHYYSQENWFQTYQHSIRLVYGTRMWKHTNNQRPLPLIVRKMPGRPRKKRIKVVGENNSQVGRVGRKITCSYYGGVGYNKSSCDKEPAPKPAKEKKVPIMKRQDEYGCYASTRGGGRGSRGSMDGRCDPSGGTIESRAGKCDANNCIGRGGRGRVQEVGVGDLVLEELNHVDHMYNNFVFSVCITL
ncbi:hypothetical protein Tco_0921813 [Tanacetum coccineum]